MVFSNQSRNFLFIRKNQQRRTSSLYSCHVSIFILTSLYAFFVWIFAWHRVMKKFAMVVDEIEEYSNIICSSTPVNPNDLYHFMTCCRRYVKIYTLFVHEVNTFVQNSFCVQHIFSHLMHQHKSTIVKLKNEWKNLEKKKKTLCKRTQTLAVQMVAK